MYKHSFDPIIPTNPKILILGSLPSDVSLAQNQYYAHPQNRFWKVLFSLFDAEYSTDYADCLCLLHQQHIAIWNVCASAYRAGSMDTAIANPTPNPIDKLLNEHPSIKAIYFNGQKAQKLFDLHFDKKTDITYICLPSTSPANAQYSLSKLIDSWKIIQKNIL